MHRSLILIGLMVLSGCGMLSREEKMVLVPRALAEDLESCKHLATRSCPVSDYGCSGKVRRMCIEAMGWERRGERWANPRMEIRCPAK